MLIQSRPLATVVRLATPPPSVLPPDDKAEELFDCTSSMVYLLLRQNLYAEQYLPDG
ncbi:hypothetical protein [Hymenobacter sp. AT01-02]|uniref:hypothetical protein n=1 Tax=Hymenobacter sp. AT01-02 TaxID=1571877 RepID=UPI000A89B2B7|nr:hypothetical protein [Hymenobacter sp. AT01-02]